MSSLSPLLDEQRTTYARYELFRFLTHMRHGVPSELHLQHLSLAGREH